MNSTTFQSSESSDFQFPTTLATLTMVAGLCLTQASFANLSNSSANPFGLELGQATCEQAKTQLKPVKEQPLQDGDILVKTASPEKIYPGASQVFARCRGNRVIAVVIESSKGGMDNSASRSAFATLNSKYKLVKGGPMPSLGNGYARFAAGNSVIEQDAPHLSFEFTISYFEKSFFEELVSDSQKRKQETANKKQSSL